MSSSVRPPPVALVHGWGSTAARTYDGTALVTELEHAGRTTHLIDLPGHGERGGSHMPEDYADLAGLTAARFPAGQLDAVGYSLGGKVLLWLEAAQPGTFRRIVVAGVGANLFSGEKGAVVAEAVHSGGVGIAGTPIDGIVTEALASGNDPGAVAAVITRPSTPLPRELLARCTAEVLLICGDGDKIAIDPDVLRDALPNASLQLVPGAGHDGLIAIEDVQRASAAFILG